MARKTKVDPDRKPNAERFGVKFETLLANAGWSQPQAAAEFGVSQQTVSEWVRSKTRPKLAVLLAIARHFNVTCESLIDDHADLQYRDLDQQENELLERGRKIGMRWALRILEDAESLGYEEAKRRLLGTNVVKDQSRVIEPSSKLRGGKHH